MVKRVFEDEEYDPGDQRTHNLPPARAFNDYAVHVDWSAPPAGVELIEKL